VGVVEANLKQTDLSVLGFNFSAFVRNIREMNNFSEDIFFMAGAPKG
jgi:hypothetical protein